MKIDSKRVEEISKMSKIRLSASIQKIKSERGLVCWYTHPLHTWDKDELINTLIAMEEGKDG